MNPQIKSSYTGAVLFEGESGMTTRAMLEKATSEKSDLSGACLSGANLRDACLSWANLRDACLSWANLRGANLRGANLYGANLYGANLRGANLSGADLSGTCLSGANLRGADLGEKFGKAIGSRPYFAIGPIGSRQDNVILWITDKGHFVKAGCFFDTLEAFAAAVEKTHGDSDHGKEYAMAILMMEAHAALWTPKKTT